MSDLGFSLDNARVLAPMAGFTDSAFRCLCKGFGAEVLVTEMIAANALVHARQDPLALAWKPPEQPLGVQLSLGDPEIIEAAVAKIAERGYAFLDLNAGCPMKNTINGGAGSALLRDPPKLQLVLERLRRASPIPVTVKVRLGWTEDEICLEEVVQRAEDAGVSAITVHPRTRAQMYRGKADWEWIARAKRLVSVPVIGNGDVMNEQDAQRMREQTGCDAVMIGRAAIGSPWVFEREGAVLSDDERIERVFRVTRAHFEANLENVRPTREERFGVVIFRKHLARYLKGIPHSRAWRVELLNISDMDLFRQKLEAFEASWREHRDLRPPAPKNGAA